MDLQQLSALVQPASPLLASTLNGPGSAMALAALGKSLVDDDQASSDEIGQALSSGTSDAALKVRAAEESFLKGMNDAGVTLAQINAAAEGKRLDVYQQLDASAAADRQSARQRQISLNDSTNKWLACAVTAGFFLVLFSLIFLPLFTFSTGKPAFVMDSDIKAVLQTMLGVLGTAWISIISYYFGSSIGSKEKNALLTEAVVGNKNSAQSS